MVIAGHRLPMWSALIVWAVLWEAVGHTDAGFILPPLSAIIWRVFEIVPTPSFGEALLITGRAFVMGNAIAILVGIPLGIMMGRSVIADRLLLPWVNLFLSAPLSALVPVIMVLFGLGETTIVLTVVLNVAVRAFPRSGERVGRWVDDVARPRPDDPGTRGSGVRVVAPWKAMIVASLVLTVGVNLLLWLL